MVLRNIGSQSILDSVTQMQRWFNDPSLRESLQAAMTTSKELEEVMEMFKKRGFP
jgi:hypothetical protein